MRCKICKAERPRCDFYRKQRDRRSFYSRCKTCSDKLKSAVSRYRLHHPERVKAMAILREAVQSKRIIKPEQCSSCLSCLPPRSIQGHHEDYSKPLCVTFLCASCHKARHTEIRKQEKILRETARCRKCRGTCDVWYEYPGYTLWCDQCDFYTEGCNLPSGTVLSQETKTFWEDVLNR